MAKERITVYLNDIQLKTLNEIMREDLCTNKSFMFVQLIVNEYKRRKLKKNYKLIKKAPKEILKFDR